MDEALHAGVGDVGSIAGTSGPALEGIVDSTAAPPSASLAGEVWDARIAEDERGERIAEMAAHLDAATHRLLTELRVFDASGAWVRQGARSCAAWLSWRLGWSGGKAREHVRIARQLAKLPRIDDALRRGELSYCKVRAITRVATPANEPILLHDARYTTGEQLETLCRKYAVIQRGEPRTPLDDRLERHVRRYALEGGMVRVEATLHPEEAELVWEALTVAARARKAGAAEVHDADGEIGAEEATARAAAVAPPGTAVGTAPGVAAGTATTVGASAVVTRMDATPGTRGVLEAVAFAEAVTGAEAVAAQGAEAVVAPRAEAVVAPGAEAVVAPGAEAVVAPSAEAVVAPGAEAVVVPVAGAVVAADAVADDGWLDRILDEAGILPDLVLDQPRVVHAQKMEAVRERPAPAEPVITAFDRAQALVELAQSVLRGTRRDRSPTELIVTIPIERLTGHAPDGLPAALVGSGTGVSAETAQRLACDCGVVALVEGANGEVASVGRRTRTIHASMKRALLHRDRTCRFPGCGNRVFLEGHHIKHWAHGGETRLENLLAMCSFHHKFVHDYGFTIELSEHGDVEFRSPDGTPKPAVPQASPRPDRGWPAIQAANQNLTINATTPACGWDGRLVRYDWALDELIRADDNAHAHAHADAGPHGNREEADQAAIDRQ